MWEAHRFMGLGEAEVGYYIRQFKLSMSFLGFKTADIRKVADTMGGVFKYDLCDAKESDTSCAKPEKASSTRGPGTDDVRIQIHSIMMETFWKRQSSNSTFPSNSTISSSSSTARSTRSILPSSSTSRALSASPTTARTRAPTATLTDDPPEDPPESEPSPSEDDDNNILPAAIGGGVGGGLAVVLIAGLIASFIIRNKRKKDSRPPMPDIPQGPTDMSRVGLDGQQIGGIQDDTAALGGIAPPMSQPQYQQAAPQTAGFYNGAVTNSQNYGSPPSQAGMPYYNSAFATPQTGTGGFNTQPQYR